MREHERSGVRALAARVDEVDGHVVEHDAEVVPLVERGLEPGEVEPVAPVGERLLHPVLVGAVLPLVVAVVAGPAGAADAIPQVGDGRVGELDAELLGLHVQQNDTMPRTPLGPPLAGVRVLDLSQVLAGPVCGRILADLGADVIKIEAPHGDRTREVLPLVNGQSLYYTHANAGKRGVGVDLRTEAGAALVARLAEHADVFIENFRPGVLARRGLGADDLLARNPRLVYCSISGWGQDGPWANRQAYAPLIHAEAGRIELAARLRDEPPRQEIHNHGDINAAMCATHAVLAALFQVERTGCGQHLDVSLAEALVYTDEWSSTDVHGYGRERFFDIWTHPVFTLADGTDVAMVGNPVRVWDQWLAALGDDAATVSRRPRRRARDLAGARGARARLPHPGGDARGVPDARRRGPVGRRPRGHAVGRGARPVRGGRARHARRGRAVPVARGRRRRARSGTARRRAHARRAHRAARPRRRRARRARSQRRDLLTSRRIVRPSR